MRAAVPRFERAVWATALAAIAVAAGAWAWKREPRLRVAFGGLSADAAMERCGLPGPPPASGPVLLPTCQGDSPEFDPWLAPGAHGPGLEALASLSEDLEERRWAWEDVNTVPVVRWDGDTRVVKPGARGRMLSVRTAVDVSRAFAMERAFGYDLDRAVIRYQLDSELSRKRASLDAVLARHGVQRRHGPEGDVLAPDYEWMIEASLEDVRPVARAVLAEARRRGARGLREEFGAFASFVQELRYGESPEVGDGKHRFGLSMPLWALATGTGDGDTRAVLLAALARSVGLCEVHLVRDADHAHMLAAAAIPVLKGDKIVRPAGRTLVLVETTDHWPVGRVASRTQGERLQTVFLASTAASARATARAAAPAAPSAPPPARSGLQPSAMRAPPPAPAPRTSARSTPAR
jgi:hypothetical protein